MIISRNNLRVHRKRRVRAKIKGNAQRPRLAVFKSLTDIKVQIIDDVKGSTLVAVNLKEAKAKNNLVGAKEMGVLLAKKCLAKKITQVVFDRAGYKYHGKIKALADGAREKGLKI